MSNTSNSRPINRDAAMLQEHHCRRESENHRQPTSYTPAQARGQLTVRRRTRVGVPLRGTG